MFLTWLHKGASLWNTARRISKPYAAPRRPSYRPKLEGLENRWLPSTLTVLNTNDSGPGSLRAAIAAAQSGDTVVFDPSLQGQTINLTSGELTIDKNLDIEGPAKGGVTVNDDLGRAFSITNPSSTVTLANLGIVGNSTQGGALYDAGATLNLVYDYVFGAVQGVAGASGSPGGDGLGGAIYQADGTLTLTHCNVFGNVGGGAGGSGAAGGNALGGVIYEAAGSLALSQCRLGGNAIAGDGGTGAAAGNAMGGDIYNAGDVLTLTNCNISDSFASGTTAAGGAIYDAAGTTTSLTKCVFFDNRMRHSDCSQLRLRK